MEREHEARMAAAQNRALDNIRALEGQVRELQERLVSASASSTTREKALQGEVAGLKEDLRASREAAEVLRKEAITSSRVADDAYTQVEALKAARAKERDESRRSAEEQVCGCPVLTSLCALWAHVRHSYVPCREQGFGRAGIAVCVCHGPPDSKAQWSLAAGDRGVGSRAGAG